MIIVLLLILPLLASLLLFTGKLGKHSKNFALVASLVIFALSLVAGFAFAFATDKIMSLDLNLEKLLDIHIILKIDGISLVMVALTTLLVPIIIASTDKTENRTHNFY